MPEGQRVAYVQEGSAAGGQGTALYVINIEILNFMVVDAGKKMSFKATAKGVQRVGEIAMRDIWIHGAVFILLLATLCVGLQKLLSGPTVITTLSISVVWIIYAMVPPFLLLWYTIIGRGSTLRLWSL